MKNTTLETKMSPAPVKYETMDFPEAIRKIGEGKKVRRLIWPFDEYGVLENNILSVFKSGRIHTWIVGDGDFSGLDWVVVAPLTELEK